MSNYCWNRIHIYYCLFTDCDSLQMLWVLPKPDPLEPDWIQRASICYCFHTGPSSWQMMVILVIQAIENLPPHHLGLSSHLCDSVKLWADFGELLFAVIQSRLQLLIFGQCVLIQLIKRNKQEETKSASPLGAAFLSLVNRRPLMVCTGYTENAINY